MNKTRKKKEEKRAVSILYPDKIKDKKNKVKGFVKLSQKNGKVKITYKVENLKDGKHGFHIHEFGNLIEGCKTAGSHFNIYKHNIHGGPRSKIKHNGDLGNIKSKNNLSSGSISVSSKVISLNPCNKNSIIGRSLIVHADEDDLGKGNNKESLITGNAGGRLACGVIGLS